MRTRVHRRAAFSVKAARVSEGGAAACVSCRRSGHKQRKQLASTAHVKAVSASACAFTVVLRRQHCGFAAHAVRGRRAQMPSFVRRQWRRLAL